MLGTAVRQALRGRGAEVLQLVRRNPVEAGQLKWSPGASTPFAVSEPLDGLAAAIHLSGASVAAHRWTPAWKREMWLSRVESTRTLANSLALVLRGSCDFSVKVTNAQNAGAVGVIFIDNGTGLAGWGAGPSTVIPAFLISQSDGANLKSYIDAHTGADATLDPDPVQVPASFLGYIGKSVAYFASRGPSTGTGALKPDVSAAATDFLLAVESYDPYGELFSYNGYGTADGTSFATPMLAGAAALVMQANPGLTPLQVKSALVNTGTLSGLVTSDGSAPASITEVGSGILQAQNAVLTTLQVVPSSVSFGFLTQGGELPAAVTLVFANSGTAPVSLAMSVTPSAGHSSSSAQVLVNNSSSARGSARAMP